VTIDYSEIGMKPISDSKPAGDDIRYEPIFEDLSEEIQKLASPTATSAIDWARVITLSANS